MPTEPSREDQLPEHAIQLNYVGVKDIAFHSSRLPNVLDPDGFQGPSFAVGRSDYDPEEKTVQVITRVEMKYPADPTFVFRVELVGEFSVDDSQFPAEKVNDWADRAAFYLIFPYLREHVYSLSLRVGLPPMLLPLLHLPPYRLQPRQAVEQHAAAVAG